jgi:hypothetical protein
VKKEKEKEEAPPRVRPRVKATLRALGGRRVVIEGFGRRAPAFVVVVGGKAPPIGVWLSPRALRRLAVVAKRVLK